MATRLIFATREQIQAYAVARGLPNALSSDPATSRTYTATQVEQADLRANDYIWQRFYNRFAPEFQANTLAELREDVRCALQDAVSIAAVHELREPNVFSLIFNPAEDQEVVQVGDIKLSPSKHANTTIATTNTQAQDVAIHYLLDAYLLVPENPNTPSNVCPPTGGLGFGIGSTGR